MPLDVVKKKHNCYLYSIFYFYFLFPEFAGRRLKCVAQGHFDRISSCCLNTVSCYSGKANHWITWHSGSGDCIQPWSDLTFPSDFFLIGVEKPTWTFIFPMKPRLFLILRFRFLQQGDLPSPFTVIHDLILTENKPSSYRHTIEHFCCCSSPELTAGQWHLFSFRRRSHQATNREAAPTTEENMVLQNLSLKVIFSHHCGRVPAGGRESWVAVK